MLFKVMPVAAQAAALPETPAGHALAAWLDAFNSGDDAQMKSYLEKYQPDL